MKNEVASLEGKKASLENSINYKKSNEYIEEQARNELNLIKPNEKVFVAPKVLGEQAEQKENEQNPQVIEDQQDEKSNPELWFSLFF